MSSQKYLYRVGIKKHRKTCRNGEQPCDECHHHSVSRAEAGDLVPGPCAQADDQHDMSHEVIICD